MRELPGRVTPELARRHAALVTALSEHMSPDSAQALVAVTASQRKPPSQPLQ